MTHLETLRMEILKLTDNELREIIEQAIAEHKKRRFERSRNSAMLLTKARKARFIGRGSSRLPHAAEGTILKINQRSVCVDFGQYGNRWRVDASFLAPIV
ncbi:MAG: hypothetical protein A2283_14020 [Lentisphaerae bacterium RIFOXYA12_FULL_48_11]|nr:MAG: hypothetical protein A2283_14020 [Lentisphaerae bacterium RIFOXYA12_FULL_48_11]